MNALGDGCPKGTGEMLPVEQQELYAQGAEAVENGDTRFGLKCLEKLYLATPGPLTASYYAVCLAKERRQADRAMELCAEAMEEDPGNSLHYLNLGRVLLATGMKREAIKAFRDGLLYGRDPRISRELEWLGWRHLPVIPSMGREHLFNRVLGKILYKLGLR
jgi:predicted Zn-dependent protease